MKNGILKFAVILCLSAGVFACTSDATDDLNVDIPEQTTDPDETEPGCDNPNGCLSS